PPSLRGRRPARTTTVCRLASRRAPPSLRGRRPARTTTVCRLASRRAPPSLRGRRSARTAMIRVLDARQLGVDAVVAALARPPAAVPPEIHRAVDGILTDVRARGDAALLDLTARFDGFTAATPAELVITPDEFETAARQLAPDIRAALVYAAERIERYQAAAVPARVAGVREIVLVTPPGPGGRVEPVVLAAARLAGVTEGYRLGGAQAVAALAYGTTTIRRVDKIVGPGNIYVALAKARVFGEVGIDMMAGPSEVVVVADAVADPAWVAGDMLAQAEHDP